MSISENSLETIFLFFLDEQKFQLQFIEKFSRNVEVSNIYSRFFINLRSELCATTQNFIFSDHDS